MSRPWAFGPVEGAVGEGHELRRGARLLQVADARRDRERDARRRLARSHQRAEPLGGVVRAQRVGLGHEPHELLAPEAPHEVARPGDPLQGVRDRLEHEVADLVAVDVVDLLEVVEVEQRDGEGSLVPVGPRHLAPDRLVHGPVVREARQRVAGGTGHEPAAGVGVRDRQAHEVGEPLEAVLLLIREHAHLGRRRQDRSPGLAVDRDRSGHAGAVPLRAHPRGGGVVLGERRVVDGCRSPRTPGQGHGAVAGQ